MSKLVGEYLRDIAPLTANHIVAALRSQLILKDEGQCRLIGDILLDEGHITTEQLEEALRRQDLARGARRGLQQTYGLPPSIHGGEQPHLSL